MKRRILFIGAGKFQVAGIKKAKDMGLEVIAVDGNPLAEGFAKADHAYAVDIKDFSKVIKIANDHKAGGVLTVASDIGVKTVAAVSEALDLPGITMDVAQKSTDKQLMRQAFKEHGVPTPQSYAVFSMDELRLQADAIGFPVVVKPADSAGSRGVRLVQTSDQLREAYEKALGNSSSGKVLVESFMDGVEVSVEAFVDKGMIHIVTLSDKVRTQPPFLLDIDVIFPSAFKDEVQEKIIAVAKKAIKAVGINMGPVHMELMITKDGPIPVELAARGPGFKVFTDIIPMTTGVDVVKALIDVSMGDVPDLKPGARMASALKFFSARDGVVKDVCGMDNIRRIPGVYEAECYVSKGDKVRALTCGADRIGHVISLTKTRNSAVDAIEEAQKVFEIKYV